MKEEKRLFANVEFNLETATQTIANLVSQNANLQQKINNAIEYIKDELCQGGPREIADLVNGYAVLEILGGKE